MTGRAKIEGLTNTWYGFAVFSAAYALVTGGIGIWNIGKTGIGLLVSWFFTFLIGRALLRKSSLVRTILLVVSGISVLLGTYSAGSSALSFMAHWELGLLFTAVYSAVGAWMNAKSFRTLTDSSVKAYFH
jgi:hypothetical protein